MRGIIEHIQNQQDAAAFEDFLQQTEQDEKEYR